jgi:hypothetical protein
MMVYVISINVVQMHLTYVWLLIDVDFAESILHVG